MSIEIDAVRRWLAERPHRTEPVQPGDRLAAVAAILRPAAEGGSEVLLIERAHQEGDPWSGHMAFPGGRHEPTDRDLLHTALRETWEEVGLDLERHGELLGRLDDLAAVAGGQRVGLVIAPFVFSLRQAPPPLVANQDEVGAVVWASLAPLARGESDTTLAHTHEGRALRFPGYDVDGRVVWGLTYRMLSTMIQDVLSHVRRER